MSSSLNSKIRGKKIEFFSEDENLISIALSLIWLKTNKKIESCIFEKDRVKISYKKNEGRVYFDLQESLSGFTFIDKVKRFPSLRFYCVGFCLLLFHFGQFCPFFSFFGQFLLLFFRYFFSFLDNFVPFFHFLGNFFYFFFVTFFRFWTIFLPFFATFSFLDNFVPFFSLIFRFWTIQNNFWINFFFQNNLTELERYKSLCELYKSRCELGLNHSLSLQVNFLNL